MTQTILPAEWQPCLDRFSADHCGERASVRVYAGFGWTDAMPSVALRDVACRPLPDGYGDDHGGGCDILVVGVGPFGPVEHTIERPLCLRCVTTMDGRPFTLIIDPLNGPPTMVRLPERDRNGITTDKPIAQNARDAIEGGWPYGTA